MEIEQEVSSDPEDPRELHPGALLYRSSRLHNLPLMAEALAHGADVHTANEEEEGKTPLIQAVIGVRDLASSPNIYIWTEVIGQTFVVVCVPTKALY